MLAVRPGDALPGLAAIQYAGNSGAWTFQCLHRLLICIAARSSNRSHVTRNEQRYGWFDMRSFTYITLTAKNVSAMQAPVELSDVFVLRNCRHVAGKAS